jgi:hypothetical protein
LQLRTYTTGVRSHLVGKARAILNNNGNFLDGRADNLPAEAAKNIENLLTSKRFFCAEVQCDAATGKYKVRDVTLYSENGNSS